MTSPKIIAVIPAYNEARTIGAVVNSLRPLVAEVIVVDDHSSDNTAKVARAEGAIVLSNHENYGYDGSIDRGFKEAAKLEAEIIFTFDADGEHDASDVPRVIGPILEGKADIVAGLRPHIRHWGEWIFATYTRLAFGIRDPLCGFKAYRREVFTSVGFFDSKQSIGTELMIRGIKKGFRIALVPIQLHDRVDDSSRIYAFNLKGNLKILRAMLRILFI